MHGLMAVHIKITLELNVGVRMSPEEQLMHSQRVAKGVAFLDKVQPDWRDVVNWDQMNMQDPSRCVLGQTRGYRKTVGAHGRNGGRWAEEHGFFTSAKGESTKEKYDYLELLWQKQAGDGKHETYK
jgi:hypothetical protein